MKNIVAPSNTQKSFNISPVKNKYGYDGIMYGRSSGESEKWKGHPATVALYTFHSSVIDHHLSPSVRLCRYSLANILFILCRHAISCVPPVCFFSWWWQNQVSYRSFATLFTLYIWQRRRKWEKTVQIFYFNNNNNSNKKWWWWWSSLRISTTCQPVFSVKWKVCSLIVGVVVTVKVGESWYFVRYYYYYGDIVWYEMVVCSGYHVFSSAHRRNCVEKWWCGMRTRNKILAATAVLFSLLAISADGESKQGKLSW